MGRIKPFVLVGVLLAMLVMVLILPWRGWMHTVNREKLYAAPPLPLYKGVRLTQTIKPRYPGLYRVDILLRNQPADNGEITLIVKTDCNEADKLVERTIPESVIPDVSFQSFEFEPLSLPPDQDLCLELLATAADRNNNLAVGASLGDANPDGQASYTVPVTNPALPASGTAGTAAYRLYLPLVQRSPLTSADRGFDIGYRLYYTSTPISTIDALLTYLAAYKPGVFGTRWYYLLLGGAYLLILGLFLMIAWRMTGVNDRQ